MNNNSSLEQMSTASTFPTLKTRTLLSNHNGNFILSMIMIHVVMAFIITSMNLLVILTFVKTTSLRETPSNILVLGLAISDFGVGILSQPLLCAYEFTTLTEKNVPKQALQQVCLTVVYTLSTASFLTLTAITVDRFLAVHLHLRYQELVTTKRYGITLTCIWIYTFAFCLGRLFHRSLAYDALVIAVVCCILSFDVYLLLKIYQVIHRHSVQIQTQQQSTQQSIDMPRYKKSVNTMYYVIGAFVFCYIPVLGTLFIFAIKTKTKEEWVSFYSQISILLLMLNSLINPIIYCWRLDEMRSAAKRLILGLWRQNEN